MTPADRYLLNRLTEVLDILYLAGPFARASAHPRAELAVKIVADTVQALADQLQADPEDEDEPDDDGTPVELKPVLGEPVAVRT